MRIKKHWSFNEYINVNGVHVRNFTKKNVIPFDISNLFSPEDHDLIIRNELQNNEHPLISDEKIVWSKAVIVSDGYDFDRRHRLLKNLPRDVSIIAINGALKGWKGIQDQVPINIYVTNNPYVESLNDLPSHGYFPTCVCSSRTNAFFLKKYAGSIYCYEPSLDENFGTDKVAPWYIDDYRNPICAAIGLAYQFKVQKLMLLCCDESFAKYRESSVRLDNGLYSYPQHLQSHDIIDTNLHWLTNQEDWPVEVANFSSGPAYNNAVNVTKEEQVVEFFTDKQELSK